MASVLGQRLKQLRRAADLSLTDVAKVVGIDRTYLGHLEAGRRKAPSIPVLESLARFYEVSVPDLLAPATPEKERGENLRREIDQLREHLSHIGTILSEPGMVDMPVYGNYPAGLPEMPTGEVIDILHIPANAVAVRVSGDSLTDLGVLDGDIVVVDAENKEPRDGQIVIARLSLLGEVTIKQFYRENDHIRLEPANTKYKAIRSRDVEVLGVVTMSIRKH